MKYLFFLVFFFSLLNLKLQAQQKADFKFINHLLENKFYDDALFLLENNSYFQAEAKMDSSNFFSGKISLSLQKYNQSLRYFEQINSNSPLFEHSIYYKSLNYSFQKQPYQSILLLENSILNQKNQTDTFFYLFLSGNYLLNKETEKFDSISILLSKENQQTWAYRQLKVHSENIQNFKPKSLFWAGCFSAILPGSGKYYANEKGSASAAFYILSFLAGLTVENYLHQGIRNYKTITFGGLFTVFYFGNIYGSVISAQKYNHSFYENTKKSILTILSHSVENHFDCSK